MSKSKKHGSHDLSSERIAPMIKIGVAVLLLLCFTDIPVQFNKIIHCTVACAFGYLAYDYFRGGRNLMGLLFVALAMVFQPFYQIAVGQTIWNFLTIAVIVWLFTLIISAFMGKK